jgi:hypothetical protein
MHNLAVALHFGIYKFVRNIKGSEPRLPWALALKKGHGA